MAIDVTPLISGRVEAFALLLVRVTTLLLAVPLFGNRVIPLRIRILAGLALTVALLPSVPAGPSIREAGALGFAVLVAREVTFPLKTRHNGDNLTVTGTLDLLMTDYGIAPPKAMLGMIKAGPGITLTFDILVAITAT